LIEVDEMVLLLSDLVVETQGTLRLAAMPPRERELTPIARLVMSAQQIQPGDVFWQLNSLPGDAEMAFLRGAIGVVASNYAGEPWPGCFCLDVLDGPLALARVLAWVADVANFSFPEHSCSETPELKGLQLCGEGRVDISPPTCGRVVKSLSTFRCRRQAA
jgi:hypothetical protein